METPMICPACGELVIAWLTTGDYRLLPEHRDRIEPDQACTSSLATLRSQIIGPAGTSRP